MKEKRKGRQGKGKGREKGSEREENWKGKEIKLKNERLRKEIRVVSTLYTHECFSNQLFCLNQAKSNGTKLLIFPEGTR